MFDELKVKQGMMRLMIGNITSLEVEAIVYYARPDLALGSGFGGVIAAEGGPQVQEELKKIGTVKTTEAVISSGGNLKARYIIHAVGPRFQEEEWEEKLRTTVLNVFRKADEKGIKSLAFPAMGIGFYGVPVDVCARETLGMAKKYMEGSNTIQEITFCLNEPYEYKPFQEQLEKMK